MSLPRKPTEKYLDCIRRFPLKPIRTDEENESAAVVCDEMLDRFDTLSRQELDYFEVLSKLVEDYESRWKEEISVEPRELVKFLMSQNDLSQTDLIPEFGSSSRVSEFLSGKRVLSLGQIQKLAKRFSLAPAAFLETSGRHDAAG